jgi:hypothetical protein
MAKTWPCPLARSTTKPPSRAAKREQRMNPKCLGGSVPDTFNARSAHLTGLKMIRITRAASFDHLVGAGEQCRWHSESERIRRLEIKHQIVLDRRLHRQVGRLFALENAVT